MLQSSRFEIADLECDGFRMTDGLARYLAKDHIAAAQRCQHQSRTDLGTGKDRERKRDYDDFTAYKSRHAASSSGLSQSFAHAD
jgi:hypothetical protein